MTSTRDRIGRMDLLLTAFCVALGVLLMLENINAREDPLPNGAPWTVLPLFLLVTLPMLWRSIDPLKALGAVIAGLLIHSLVFGPVVRCGAAFPTIAFLAFAAGARLPKREAAIGLGLALLAALVVGAWEALGFAVVTMGAPITLIAWACGRVAHSRGELAQQLRERGADLRAARDERARLEVAADRAQLGTELQTLVEARLGQLATLADEGAAADPASATAVLVDIEQGSRETLEQMRELVGVLRDTDTGAPIAPQPTLTSLQALLMRSKGADANIRIEGNPRALPPAVELSAYRVAEQLLDALDDAEGVEVTVRFDEDAVVLSVSGPAKRRLESGAAMQRARERVQLSRGTLESVVRGGRAELRASLPVYAAV